MTSVPAGQQPDERIKTIREKAEEAIQWAKDFREGLFHVHCHRCGAGEPYLPPELFGLVQWSEDVSPEILSLEAELRSLREENAYQETFWSGKYLGVIRALGEAEVERDRLREENERGWTEVRPEVLANVMQAELEWQARAEQAEAEVTRLQEENEVLATELAEERTLHQGMLERLDSLERDWQMYSHEVQDEAARADGAEARLANAEKALREIAGRNGFDTVDGKTAREALAVCHPATLTGEEQAAAGENPSPASATCGRYPLHGEPSSSPVSAVEGDARTDPRFPHHIEGCICPRFKDIAPNLIADLTCPVHGVDGTDPGDRIVSAEGDPRTTEGEACACGHHRGRHGLDGRFCTATVYTDAPLGGGGVYPCLCRAFSGHEGEA